MRSLGTAALSRLAKDMKALHAIKPDIEDRYLQAAWAAHIILEGPGNTGRYRFQPTADGGMFYGRIGRTPSRLNHADVNQFNTPEEIQRRGRFPDWIKDYFDAPTP